MRYEPRPYQQAAKDEIRQAFRDGKRKIALVAPTGSGKTYMASSIIEGAVAKGNRILFLAHRKELIDQCSSTLDEIGVDHGVIKANHWRSRPELPVQVASVQTLYAKKGCPDCKAQRKTERSRIKNLTLDGDENKPEVVIDCARCAGVGKIQRAMPVAQIVIIDECHRCLAPIYQEVLSHYPSALVLGLTATPWRLDGRGLGRLYEHIVATVGIDELVEMGFLLPQRVYAPDVPDLSDVSTRHGDYDSDEVSRIMGSDKLVGNIIEHWQRLGEDRLTVAFCSNVENSRDMVRRFGEIGVKAEHLDGSTPDAARAAILARLAEGTTKIVCNVDVLVEGYDLPALGCAILARPTKSLTRYLQQVGRVMRPYGDQMYAIILDHAGCVHEHGLPTEPRRWSLEDRAKKKRGSVAEEAFPCVQCEQCGAIRSASVKTCAACSAIQVAVFRGIMHERDEDLVEYKSTYKCTHCEGTHIKLEPWSDLELKMYCHTCKQTAYVVDKQAAKQANNDRRRKEFDRLQRIQQSKGMKAGWVSHTYRKIFGGWPPKSWATRELEKEVSDE